MASVQPFHGVFVTESPTSLVAPVIVDSAVQVAIGTAPVNMGSADDVLSPQIAYSYDEAVAKLGFSTDFMTYTLCQAMRASFVLYNVAPIIMINVLDPSKHTKTMSDATVDIVDKKAVLAQTGVMMTGLTVKSDDSTVTFEENIDYSLSFDDSGYLVVSVLSGGAITAADVSLTISGKRIDPGMVTSDDILAGINRIQDVYPMFQIVPGTLLAPGWSHMPEVYLAMAAQTIGLSGMFRCMALSDIDTAAADSYDEVNVIKKANNITNVQSIALWPLCRVGSDIYHMSALTGAHIAFTDYLNGGVPYVSPSNKTLAVSGLCDSTGKEVIIDQQRGNFLNLQGICTAANINGWRFWGNRTAGYPGNTDVKDAFIPVRRMFNWWANTFILTYFQKVDDPMNKRLIEAVVDSENIRANGFKARLQIADAYIEYRPQDNPETDLLNGIIRFKQYLTSFPPAETIVNDLEFNPYALSESLL